MKAWLDPAYEARMEAVAEARQEDALAASYDEGPEGRWLASLRNRPTTTKE